MIQTGFGDMAQQFTLARNTTAIKADLGRLTNSLSTGKVGDLTIALGGDTARYSGLSYDLVQLDAFMQTNREIQLALEQRQTALGRLDAMRGDAAEDLLRITDLSNADQIDLAANTGAKAFAEAVDVLNMRLGDRSLFAGTEVSSPALVDSTAMLDAIAVALPPAATASAIIQAVDNYFTDPAGGFTTSAYLGSPTPGAALRVSEGRQITATPAANDPRFRSLLAAGAMAAMAEHLPGLDDVTRKTLLSEAGRQLYGAGDGLTAIRAEIGGSEETLVAIQSEQQARRTVLGIARNQLDQSDPFETATALQAIQLQLETHFSAMSRLSQLSLLRFI